MATRRRSGLLAFTALILAGAVLVVAPWLVRTQVLGFNSRAYVPPETGLPPLAATPAPTPTAAVLDRSVAVAEPEVRPGAVVIDLAHYSQLNPAGLQPLASALAQHGRVTRLWLSDVDALEVEQLLDFPDQSEELERQLRDAGALVVVSPFFLYTPQEVAVVESFVADGGRLLIISDPDIFGDAAVFVNLLAEPFGAVFNDDYLYDTVRNDENYTHFFLDDFQDIATPLAGADIALYGARSISGDVTAVARSATTTLSSRRTGVSGFTTVAVAGDSGRNTAGRVLALGDFDVLTEPNVARQDNRKLVEFVAAFLAEGSRNPGVADFPAALGKQVTLVIGMEGALDADALLLGARLQRRLEETGRYLTLAAGGVSVEVEASRSLTVTSAYSSAAPFGGSDVDLDDVVLVADFDYANEGTTLLSDVGFQLVTERITTTVPAPAPTSTPTATLTPDGAAARQQLDPTPEPPPAAPTVRPTLPSNQEPTATAAATTVATPTVAATATVTVTGTAATATPSPTATPTASPTPVEVTYLVGPAGLRLLAAQTSLILEKHSDDGQYTVAVLGIDGAGIRSGVNRLIDNDFDDCILGSGLTLCPVAGGTPAPAGQATPPPTAATPATPGSATPQPPTAGSILLVDDNTAARPGEPAEADRYLQHLTGAGHSPTLWTTSDRGEPTAADLEPYNWVIWSNAGYVDGQVGVDMLDPLFAYLNQGGRLTISSRRPFFGMGIDPASRIGEVVVVADEPELVQGLPDGPIALEGDAPVVPLAEPEGDEGYKIVFARGPAAPSPGLPAVIAATDEGEPDAPGARLVVATISLEWLPADVSERYVANMLAWMLAD